jgi:hypothetical protein
MKSDADATPCSLSCLEGDRSGPRANGGGTSLAVLIASLPVAQWEPMQMNRPG